MKLAKEQGRRNRRSAEVTALPCFAFFFPGASWDLGVGLERKKQVITCVYVLMSTCEQVCMFEMCTCEVKNGSCHPAVGPLCDTSCKPWASHIFVNVVTQSFCRYQAAAQTRISAEGIQWTAGLLGVKEIGLWLK